MIWAFLAGTAAGALSGLGGGGGTLLMLYLTTLGGVPQLEAQGTNLLFFLPCSATALGSHVKNGLVDWRAALPAVIAGLVTTLIAAFFATGLDGEWLRRVFGGFLVVVGAAELVRKG